jgi:hypothetical protein
MLELAREVPIGAARRLALVPPEASAGPAEVH